MNYSVYLSPPHFNNTDTLDLNTLSTNNHFKEEFSNELVNLLKVKNISLLNSGTSSIHLALILLGVKTDDEVICSTFTFSASVNPIRYQKAIPVFVDSELDTWNMCPIMLENAIIDRIEKGKKPKAIILVHLYGMPSKMQELITIASKYKIPIIEDAAEALGSTYKGKSIGTFGEVGIFSFNTNKIITTFGGGALLTQSYELCQQADYLASQARDNVSYYQHSSIGFNYSMSNIAARVGVNQIQSLNDRIKKRRGNFFFYKEQLSSINSISFLDEPEGFYSNRWLTTILTDNFHTREKIRLTLERMKIESRPLWKPMHQQPIFEQYPKYLNGVSDDLFERGLCLPSGSDLTSEQKQRIIGIITSVF